MVAPKCTKFRCAHTNSILKTYVARIPPSHGVHGGMMMDPTTGPLSFPSPNFTSPPPIKVPRSFKLEDFCPGRGPACRRVVYHTSLLISASSGKVFAVLLAHTCVGVGLVGGWLGGWTDWRTVRGRWWSKGWVGQTSVNYGGRKTFTALPRREKLLCFFFFWSLLRRSLSLRVPGDTRTQPPHGYTQPRIVYTPCHSPGNPKSICFSTFSPK